MEGHGRSFLDTRFTFKVRKVMGCWFVCRIILSTPIPFLCDLDLGFGTQDLDMGLTVVLSVKFLSEKLFTELLTRDHSWSSSETSSSSAYKPRWSQTSLERLTLTDDWVIEARSL